MAFVTRSGRESRAGNGGTGELGPGEYLGHETYTKKRHAYAPFQSTTQRETREEVSTFCSPPPGHYDPKIPGVYETVLPKKYIPFKSTTQRFSHANDTAKKLDLPGPGSYDIKGMCQDPKNMHQTMGVPTILERLPLPERAASAPSIPARAQCFGYEEGQYGKLVRQDPPQHQQPHAAIGPDHYNIDDGVVRKRVVGGHIPSTLRQKTLKSATPGPGHYLEKRMGETSKWRRPGACFVSKVSRLAKLDKKHSSCPGPGEYDASLPSKPGQSDHQFFGSTVERFRQRSRTTAPGPGAYQASRTNCAGGKLPTKTERFEKNTKHAVPGPGQYEATEGFGIDAEKSGNYQKSFSVLGNQGSLAFGAMSRRFVKSADGVRGESGDPGPGAYETRDAKKFCRTEPSSFFKSRTPKDPPVGTTPHPSPGAYDPQHVSKTSEVLRVPQKKEGFLTGTDRFRAAKETPEATLGPGHYNPELKGAANFNCAMGATFRGTSSAQSIGFTSCSHRFDELSKKMLPGPGEYNLGSEWVKKSYNCLFGEVL